MSADGGGDDNADGDDNGGEGDAGYTNCGSERCSPGQYCSDPTLRDCTKGCLSNENCASDQYCNTEEERCENITEKMPGDGANCDAFCDRAIDDCGLNVSQAECEQTCRGLADACVACAIEASCDDETTCLSACGGGGNEDGEDAGDDGGSFPADLGKSCFSDLSCRDSSCIGDDGVEDEPGICSVPCTTIADCPNLWDCEEVDNGQFCLPL